MDILFLDTETGGVDPTADALLTVGMIATKDEPFQNNILKTMYIEVLPETYKVGAEALAINKINLAEHSRNASFRKKSANMISEFIHDVYGDTQPTLMGHNTSFDLGFMNELFNSTGTPIPYSYRSMDTAGIALVLRSIGIETGNNLPSLLDYYDVKYSEDALHNAMTDALLTREVYLNQKKHLIRLLEVR